MKPIQAKKRFVDWKLLFILWKEQGRVIRRFYFANLRYAFIDLNLHWLYLGSNPYRMCRKFFQKRGEPNIHLYGETPLTTWASIVALAKIQKNDHFLDLGCGRGRLCFWTHYWIGCQVTGIDWVSSFIRRANFLSRLFRMQNIQFVHQRMIDVSLEQATVIFLYTYHPDEECLDWEHVAIGTRIITVSDPILKKGFTTIRQMTASFPWGETDVYVNKKI